MAIATDAADAASSSSAMEERDGMTPVEGLVNGPAVTPGDDVNNGVGDHVGGRHEVQTIGSAACPVRSQRRGSDRIGDRVRVAEV